MFLPHCPDSPRFSAIVVFPIEGLLPDDLGIPLDHRELQEAKHPRSADFPGFRLHPLKGDSTGQRSVCVSGNWRVVLRFEEGEAVDVDLVDYH